MKTISLVLTGVLSFTIAGCSGNEGACTAGSTQECLCAPGVHGVQICAENSTSWLACDCPEADTSTDSLQDTTDTQDDTATDPAPDIVEDTPVDSPADTIADAVEDTQVDSPADTIADAVEDTAWDTASDTIADSSADTPVDTYTDVTLEEEAPECTRDGDCDNHIFCDGAETCRVDGTCQDGSPVTCVDSNPCTSDRCNEDDDECTFNPTDSDGDGFAAATGPGGEACPGTDCDDTSNLVHPGAAPTCDGTDQDCTGAPDNDEDEDTFISYACGGMDCDDGNPGVSSGVWHDPTTGYLWEDPPMGGPDYWDDVVSYCNGLSLCGFAAGAWHVPTISELRTLIRGCPATEDGGACGLTDTCLGSMCRGIACNGCSSSGGPGAGGCYWDPALHNTCADYWSSSLPTFDPASVYFVTFYSGGIFYDDKEADPRYVRCVSP